MASVSCILWFRFSLKITWRYDFIFGKWRVSPDRDHILRRLVGIQYERNDISFERGTFRVRGDVIEIIPASSDRVIRIEVFGDEVDRILELDLITGEVIRET